MTGSDFIVSDEGSIVTFYPRSDAAQGWWEENVHAEPWQCIGRRWAVDHRMAQNLVNGIEAAGFTIN
jgi:hypothetical protein